MDDVCYVVSESPVMGPWWSYNRWNLSGKRRRCISALQEWVPSILITAVVGKRIHYITSRLVRALVVGKVERLLLLQLSSGRCLWSSAGHAAVGP